MNERGVGPDQLAERERVRRLLPQEKDFIDRPGYERTYRDPKDESKGYDWSHSYQPNDGHGKPTREFNEVGEMIKPFMRADVERVQNMPSGPALTDDAVRQRGWSHARRGAGTRVERGIDGERWCLTTPYPWTPVPEGGNADGSWPR